ncbi:MAG: putative N-acetyltransferase YafP [Chroococcidiopsis sp. SAG 2025]|uniref:GNAT family N-acetyltransferase n=1 Tax=Chroococcidiopsis sp. SAG 2025 TaxID=171389 RepID=UPI002936D929|nr:GNAT family N-acetyltransferase [Chroococcidiopsis sp. SAG 2025]MDV2996173.1 putative N-acetyltransferase YafP [Chroococcidiopsis sp. SAG 2025]
MQISVRRAKTEDAEQICQVHIASVRELCKSNYTPEQIEAWVGKLKPEGHRQAIENPNKIMFIAEIERRIAGFSELFETEVNAVYVHPNYSRQGVGKLLLNIIEQEAIAQHIERLTLSASTNAKLFYQACGYQVIEYSFHTLRSGTKIPCILMEKNLIQDSTF